MGMMMLNRWTKGGRASLLSIQSEGQDLGIS
jgi:hypothetical protein